MDYGKSVTVHTVCMQGCGTEWDQFVPAGKAEIHTCRACMAGLVEAFFAGWDEETYLAEQAAMREASGFKGWS